MCLSRNCTTLILTINVKYCAFSAQTHVDPGKCRALDFKLLIIETYLELSNEIGTISEDYAKSTWICNNFTKTNDGESITIL